MRISAVSYLGNNRRNEVKKKSQIQNSMILKNSLPKKDKLLFKANIKLDDTVQHLYNSFSNLKNAIEAFRDFARENYSKDGVIYFEKPNEKEQSTLLQLVTGKSHPDFTIKNINQDGIELRQPWVLDRGRSSEKLLQDFKDTVDIKFDHLNYPIRQRYLEENLHAQNIEDYKNCYKTWIRHRRKYSEYWDKMMDATDPDEKERYRKLSVEAIGCHGNDFKPPERLIEFEKEFKKTKEYKRLIERYGDGSYDSF